MKSVAKSLYALSRSRKLTGCCLMTSLCMRGTVTTPTSQFPKHLTSGGKQVRLWQGPWERGGKENKEVNRYWKKQPCSWQINFKLLFKTTDHVVGVGDAQVLVEPLLGWEKRPICSNSQVPLAHGGGGVAQRFQHFSYGGLIQRKAALRAWVQHTRVDTRAGLIAPRQQRRPGEPSKQNKDVT